MPGFSESSLSLRVSLPLSAIAFLLVVVGMSTPYWVKIDVETSDISFGLWTVCANVPPVKQCLSIVDNSQYVSTPGWFKAVQAIEVIGTLLSFGTVVLIVMCLLLDYVGRNKISHLVAMLSCFITALFVILGVIIWAANFTESVHIVLSNPAKYLNWSFALCIVGAGFSCLTGIFMIFNLRKRWYM